MNQQEFKNVIGGESVEARENTIGYLLGQFYNPRMRSIVILVWTFALIFLAGAFVCAVLFFQTDQVKSLILYAALFLLFCQWLGMMKIFAWLMIHRNSILERIKQIQRVQL